MLSLHNLRNALADVETVSIKLPDGSSVPAHFHITEAGLVTKHFIDCGGTIRKQSAITMQIWYSYDVDHRLTPGTFLKILDKAEPLFNGEDLPIEIEYQTETIGKYHLEFRNGLFHLVPTETDCLAKEKCFLPGMESDQTCAPQAESSDICIPESSCC